MPKRASRRASLCTRRRSFFFLVINTGTNLSRFFACDALLDPIACVSQSERLASKAKECKAS
jgi:hypothetical protein